MLAPPTRIWLFAVLLAGAAASAVAQPLPTRTHGLLVGTGGLVAHAGANQIRMLTVAKALRHRLVR